MRGLFKAAVVALALLLQVGPSLATETITYTYDELGRLVAISTSGTVNNGQSVSTDFDAAGNRENYSVSGVAGATISISDASVTEGGQLSFTVTRAGNTGSAVTVNYATTTPATATSGSDFTAASGTVTFVSGDTSEIVTVSTTDDTAVESAETLTVALSNPSAGATISGAGTATGTINDNDANATISIGNASVTEGGQLSFTVTRSGSTSNAVSASYASASGTATSGSDFTAVSNTVSFAAGDATPKTITVNTTDDATVESTEAMTVTLSNPSSGATIGTATGTGTINDNDSGGGGGIITPSSYSASSNYQGSFSGLNGTGPGMRDAVYDQFNSTHGTNSGAQWVMMDLGLSQSVGNVVVVPIPSSFGGWGAAYLNGAILERSDDGTSWTTVATVSGASEGVLKQIAVNASTRYLRLRRTSSYLGVGDFYATAGGGGGGTTVSIGNASATEGGQLSFQVTRTGTGAFDVTYATSSGTAVSPGDFTAISSTVLSFGSSETSKTVTVNTIDDSTVESAETMTVTLSSPTNGATLGTSTGTGTINDNDSATATISIGNASVTEGGTLSFTVTRSGNTSSSVSASYATASGTATSGSDFTAKTGTVSFSSGQTSKTVTVSTTDDSTVESSETMTVTLSNPSSGAAIGTATGTGTINDNDSATATISIGNASGTEGATLSFTVTRSGVTSTAVSASYTTASGTAVHGSDYTHVQGTLSFSSGQTTKTVDVSTIDDASVESTENFSVALFNPSSGATIGTTPGTGTINDNDSGGGGSIITPSSYSASSNYQSYTGLNGTGAGMRDAIYDTSSSIHGTNSEAVAWIIMDLGSSQSVGNVVVVPAAASAPGGWGAAYLNGAILQQSINGTTWATVATVAGASEGVLTQIPVNTSTRYLRLRMANNYLGVGDFYAKTP